MSIKFFLIKLWFDIVYFFTRSQIIKNLEADLKEFKGKGSFHEVNNSQRQIRDGINRVKTHVKSKSKSPKDYTKQLSKIGDFFTITKGKENPIDRLLKHTYVSEGKSIETDTKYKEQVVESRISDYEELHKWKQKREFLKKLREAKKNRDFDLVKRLESEYRNQKT